jgi:hypothetical protein
VDIQEFVLRQFGEASDKEQADHFNALGAHLLEACKFDEATEESQLCYLTKYLDKHGIRMIKKLAEFIEFREEKG